MTEALVSLLWQFGSDWRMLRERPSIANCSGANFAVAVEPKYERWILSLETEGLARRFEYLYFHYRLSQLVITSAPPPKNCRKRYVRLQWG